MGNTKLEPAKKVTTRDLEGNENGFLIELFKDKETGTKTEVYLSAALPGAFKGYHEHKVRAARYVCMKGRMKIITYSREGDKWVREENILDANDPQPKRLYIPKNTPTGLENIGNEEAWLVNYPDPAYDPNLKGEQVDYTQEELEAGVVK